DEKLKIRQSCGGNSLWCLWCYVRAWGPSSGEGRPPQDDRGAGGGGLTLGGFWRPLRPDKPGPLDGRGRPFLREHHGYGTVGEDAHRTAAGTAALLDAVLREGGVF